jgi:archaemetzincin
VPTLDVVPLGEVRRVVTDAAVAPASLFGLTVRLHPALAQPAYAWNPARGQHHGAAILRKLGSHPRDERGVILGVGPIDLFVPDVPFVLADWDRDLRAALVGTKRFGDAPDALARRTSWAAAWAIGRALGLSDCEDRRCPLSPPDAVEGLERRHAFLCTKCDAALHGPKAPATAKG